MYGGERGIRLRTDDVTQKLMTTAQSDFAHDFGEGVPDRDKFTDKDLERFQEIVQGYGISKFAASKTAFNEILGSNPYNLLKSSIINNKIFPVVGNEKQFLNEDATLKALGIDYAAIKKAFKDEKAKNAATLNASALKIPNLEFKAPGGETRIYEVTGVLMKDKAGDGVLNIASRFQLVTRGKSRFAMVIDASGGLSMSSIVNTELGPAATNDTAFYIIENIENDADSATKLKHFDKPKKPLADAKKVDLFFLQDQIQSVLYPNFKVDAAKTDGELLFGNADLLLSRAGEDMEADFTFPGDTNTYHIENVSQNANVKNASLNIVASTLAKGGNVSRGGIVPGLINGKEDKTPYLFPYIKRVGDWCQALSLLDGSRKYSELDATHKPTGRIGTLDDLRKDEINTAVGLLTLDRILLGYALSLGIDVFFTTQSDLRLLIYFHNTETTLSDEAYNKKIEELRPKYEAGFADIGRDNVSAIIDEGLAYIMKSTSEVDYIQRLRGVFYRLSVLRSDFTNLGEKLASINTQLASAQDAKTAFGLYSEGIAILSKLKADEVHNETQRNSFATYPALVDEKPSFTMIVSRPGSRAAVTKLKTVLSKDIYNDAIQCKKLLDKYEKKVQGISYFPTTTPVFVDIFTALNEINIIFGGPQTGGGPGDIQSLKQFIVTPLEKSVYEAVANGMPPPPGIIVNEDTPLPLVLYSYYRDKESHPYTVVDNYIITQEDLPVFERIARDGFENTAEEAPFVASRLILLYLDILKGDLEAIRASEDDDITTVEKTDPVSGVTFEVVTERKPSDVKITNHKRVYYKAVKMLESITLYLSRGDYVNAFVNAFQEYNGSDLLDNDSINAIAGRDGLLNPADFDKTAAKIETARSALLRLYSGAPTLARKAVGRDTVKKNVKSQGIDVQKQITRRRNKAEQIKEQKAQEALGKRRVANALDETDDIESNDEVIDVLGGSAHKHSRLRKRSRTRRARRVR